MSEAPPLSSRFVRRLSAARTEVEVSAVIEEFKAELEKIPEGKEKESLRKSVSSRRAQLRNRQ